MDAISAAGLWVLVLLTDTRTGLLMQTTHFTSQESCYTAENKILSLKNTSVVNISCLETTSNSDENPETLVLLTDTIVGLLMKNVSSLPEETCSSFKRNILDLNHDSVKSVECITK